MFFWAWKNKFPVNLPKYRHIFEPFLLFQIKPVLGYLNLFFHEQGINVTLKPQSDPTASKVVDGYTKEMLNKLYNGMPQRGYTETKRHYIGRPKPRYAMPKDTEESKDVSVPALFQVEFKDSNGKR